MSISPELRRELLTLPAEERQELADELYESLVDESLDPEWEREWSNESEQRMKDVADNRVELIDADDVHRELHAVKRLSERDIILRLATSFVARSPTTKPINPAAVFDLEQAVRRVIRRIQLLPQSAPRWPRIEANEIRRAKVKRHPYLVVYAVLPDQLVVLAIAHTSKRPGYWRERLKK